MILTLPTTSDLRTPLGNFGFHVSFETSGKRVPPDPFGSFAEVSGLEATMEHKVIKEGGNNYGTVMRVGPVTFATVILKRGIVEADNLWDWWSLFAGGEHANAFPGYANRCDVLIGLLGVKDPQAAGEAPKTGSDIRLIWRLRNAMPVKFRAGDLNAKGNDVAIEELHLVHEGLKLERPQ